MSTPLPSRPSKPPNLFLVLQGTFCLSGIGSYSKTKLNAFYFGDTSAHGFSNQLLPMHEMLCLRKSCVEFLERIPFAQELIALVVIRISRPTVSSTSANVCMSMSPAA